MHNRTFMRSLWISFAGILLAGFMVASQSDTRVAEAAMKGDRDAVRQLLKSGADVNAAQGDGMTALHWAAYEDDLEMAETLLYAGAKAAATLRINGMTPMFFACQNGNAKMIEVLSKAGSDANATLRTGATPLMYAARAGNAAAVKALLDAGANPNVKETGRAETPLMFAAAANRAEAVKVLMQHGADSKATTKVIDIAARTAAARAARGAQGARGGGMEERPPEIDSMGGMTALLFAARQGHVESVLALLEGGADINETNAGDKTSPLLIAAINGHFDLAKLCSKKEPTRNSPALRVRLPCMPRSTSSGLSSLNTRSPRRRTRKPRTSN